jgi:hypothetical protein
MRGWRGRRDDEPDEDDRYLTEDVVERRAEELLDRAYELAAAGAMSLSGGLTAPTDLRVVLGARDVVGWRVRREPSGSIDARAYGLIDELMPPDLRVPLGLG